MSIEQLTFTDRRAGGGVDPGAAGYQIAACSEGLEPALRELLASLCSHYGEVAYSAAPAAARDGETAWRTRTERLDAVPEEVLELFPRISCYTRLGEDLFALTRISYRGLTHDGRPGNFFAHALVLAPDDLAPAGSNPLAPGLDGSLRCRDDGEETTLPALAELACAEAPAPRFELLAEAPYREHLAAMIAALAEAGPARRPVVLCLDDWRRAAVLVEALLGLLPPPARRRTSVCTFERNPIWLPAGLDRREERVVAAHHLVVVCSEEKEGAFDLRHDESRFALFNFVDERFAGTAEPGPFAVFAASCVIDGALERLWRHHALVERMGPAGHPPTAWDALLPDVWTEESEKLVAACLEGEWNVEKEGLVRELLAWIRAEAGPARAWLRLKLVAGSRLRGEELLAELGEIARSGHRVEALLAALAERFDEPEARAVALGRLAEAATGTASHEGLLAAYRETVEELSGKSKNRVRRKLAEAGVAGLLCDEMLAELLPWDEKVGAQGVRRWQDLLSSQREVQDQLFQRLAERLAEPGRAAELLPLAGALIVTTRRDDGPGRAALYGAAVLALPLRPPDDAWQRILASACGAMAPQVEARLRILKLLRRVAELAARPGWSPAEFPHADSAWKHDVAALAGDEKAQVTTWCLATFAETGIAGPAEAQGWVETLAAVGVKDPETLAGTVAELLRGRDAVTDVLTVTAFARRFLEGKRPPERWGELLRALVRRLDRPARDLFERHLEHRFAPRDPARLAELWDVLVPPRRSAPAASNELRSFRAAGDAGIVVRVLRFLKGLLLGAGAPVSKTRQEASESSPAGPENP